MRGKTFIKDKRKESERKSYSEKKRDRLYQVALDHIPSPKTRSQLSQLVRWLPRPRQIWLGYSLLETYSSLQLVMGPQCGFVPSWLLSYSVAQLFPFRRVVEGQSDLMSALMAARMLLSWGLNHAPKASGPIGGSTRTSAR
jgi:hypothetical protein